MIDLTIYDDLVAQNKGILTDIITTPALNQNFKLERYQNDKRQGWALYSLNYVNGRNTYVYNAHDDITFISSYFEEIINRDFSSILIGGLGLGMLPYVVKNSCNIVDVIEINSSIINLIQPIGYLNGVNIIESNIYTYTPDKSYDVIVIDIWIDDSNTNLDQEINNCIYKYVPYLNENGIIYFPINRLRGQMVWDYDTDINDLIPPPNFPPPTPPV